MSEDRAATGAAQRAATGAGRMVRAYRALPHERRLAVWAAVGMFFSLFLPWYQETVIAPNKVTALQTASATITGWGAFSFVEAAVLVVSFGVLALLFQRAEGRAFHLPGGDGWVIMAAGGWICVLVIWRIFDKQSTSVRGPGATTSGIEWGIFVALAIAAFLAYTGSLIRIAHRPEPPLPGEAAPPAQAPAPIASDLRPERGPVGPPGPVAADDPPTVPTRPGDDAPTAPTRPGDDAPTAPIGPGDDAPTARIGASSAPGRSDAPPDDHLTIPFESGGGER